MRTTIDFSTERDSVQTISIQCKSFTMKPNINVGKIDFTIEGIKFELTLTDGVVTIDGPCYVAQTIIGSTLVLTLTLTSHALNIIRSRWDIATKLALLPGNILGSLADYDPGGCSLLHVESHPFDREISISHKEHLLIPPLR